MSNQEEIDIEYLVSEETETSTVEFNIVVTSSDWTLELLAAKFQNGDIIIPDYQRKFVWDIRRASTLMESFAIGLPVPQVFFYENQNGELEVIDGQQRITSISYFFEGYFGQADSKGNRKVFKLKGLEQRKDLEGKSFEELDERTKRRLKNTSLRGVTVKQLTPEQEQPESVYHIFERLNTGGQPLNAQEIRNAVYRGELLKMLEEVNKNKHWRQIYGKSESDPKQRDVELILRILAFYENHENYSPPLKDFLSREMSTHRTLNTDRSKRFADAFSDACESIVSSIEKPFRPRGLLNAAALEAVMTSTMEHYKNTKITNENYEKLLADPDFQRMIFSNTSDIDNVKQRKMLADRILFGHG